MTCYEHINKLKRSLMHSAINLVVKRGAFLHNNAYDYFVFSLDLQAGLSMEMAAILDHIHPDGYNIFFSLQDFRHFHA